MQMYTVDTTVKYTSVGAQVSLPQWEDCELNVLLDNDNPKKTKKIVSSSLMGFWYFKIVLNSLIRMQADVQMRSEPKKMIIQPQILFDNNSFTIISLRLSTS